VPTSSDSNRNISRILNVQQKGRAGDKPLTYSRPSEKATAFQLAFPADEKRDCGTRGPAPAGGRQRTPLTDLSAASSSAAQELSSPGAGSSAWAAHAALLCSEPHAAARGRSCAEPGQPRGPRPGQGLPRSLPRDKAPEPTFSCSCAAACRAPRCCRRVDCSQDQADRSEGSAWPQVPSAAAEARGSPARPNPGLAFSRRPRTTRAPQSQTLQGENPPKLETAHPHLRSSRMTAGWGPDGPPERRWESRASSAVGWGARGPAAAVPLGCGHRPSPTAEEGGGGERHCRLGDGCPRGHQGTTARHGSW